MYNHDTRDGFDLPSSIRQSRESSASSVVLIRRSRRITAHEEVCGRAPFIVTMTWKPSFVISAPNM
jgi:hypothetical protein